ncbi:siderophore ferric iron reductase [Vibrio sp. SCSIO 43137]|uniref:siderophore ferric iron reductase n=1 Tax=Vibrio sp. SCSIO 43137 TaxID=3021011 RepID=UPI00230769F7|nr:siderophore ferric iron reductase [Vibrio sp. SCSIO 43137]WCE28859.1 siderophore ferric iron reductase [Vibrio sp. SCSIO 43137]
MMQWLHKLVTQRRAPALHRQVFLYSKQITPYLKGSYGALHSDCIAIGHPNSANQLEQVYKGVAKAEPNAGKAYWLTRTWDLVCWQPVYVSFIAIYGLKSLPDMGSIGQYRFGSYIAGYRFPDGAHRHGEPEELIPHAARALMALMDFYRQQINEWSRIRPGFTRHLFADLLLGCLVKLQQHDTSLSNEYIRRQARLWLMECDLPLYHLDCLAEDGKSGQLKLTRISCCLAYKCEKGNYCDDCPKAGKSTCD